MKKTLIALIVLVVAFTIAFVAADSETQDLAGKSMAGIPGKTIRLSDGPVHYMEAGPPDGPPVVLVHGFSTPLFIWEKTMGPLAEAGFHVFAYDLYGRGYSARPFSDYGPDLYDRQLNEFLDAVGVDRPVDLAGLSMGGAIVTLFAAKHPERIRRLVLVDPAGMTGDLPTVRKMAILPVVGEVLMRFAGNPVLTKGAKKAFHGQQGLEEFEKRYRQQLKIKGTKRALLMTLRNFDLTDQSEAYRRVAAERLPVLLVWGEKDAVIPFKTHERILKTLVTAEFLPVPDAGHVPQYEAPETVNPAIISFLLRKNG